MSSLEILRKTLDEKEIDALILVSEVNTRYFSSFKFSDGMLLILKNKAYLITDFRYFEDAQKKADKDFEVVMPGKRWDFIKESLSTYAVKTVAFERSVTYNFFSTLTKELKEYKLLALGSSIEEIRQIKRPDEIQKMSIAQSITDNAFSHLLTVIKPDMTEREVALELEFFMRKNGAEALAFDTIAVSGDASALPHGVGRDVQLKKGFLTVDFGAVYDGYCSDMTRTISIGKATDKMKHMYDTVLSAQIAVLDYMKAGRDCAATDSVAREIIYKAGYEGRFGHGLGHGVGLEIHEAPSVSSSAKGKILKSGNVVTDEPGIYIQGEMGIRIEDMVLIQDNGIYDFTQSTKELIEIY